MNTVRNLCLVISLADAKTQDIFDYQMDKLTGDHETTLRKTFRIITAMEGLNELGVEFNGTIGPKPGRKTELLMPLGMVTPTRRFEVRYHGGKR
jgi:hypothetical protein